MNISNFSTIVASIYIFVLGVFIFLLPDRKKIKNSFALLCLLISIWIVSFWIRQIVPIDFRHFVLDWMLIPTVFFPILLDKIVSYISDPNHKMKKIKFGALFFLSTYFIAIGIACEYSKIYDYERLLFSSTIHYHSLMLYHVLYTAYCTYKLNLFAKGMQGNQRVRLRLMSFGIVFIIIFAFGFLYILPMVNFNAPYMAPIGALLCMSLWSVAILQYNAFELKSDILSGKEVPFLNRITLYPFLGIYSILEPVEYEERKLEFNTNTVSDFLTGEQILKSNTNLNMKKRAEVLARRFDKYIK
ncbi:LIC10906 family membrane protein [Leptospira kmetyi]